MYVGEEIPDVYLPGWEIFAIDSTTVKYFPSCPPAIIILTPYSHDIDPHSYYVDSLEEGRAFKEQSLFACKQAAL